MTASSKRRMRTIRRNISMSIGFSNMFSSFCGPLLGTYSELLVQIIAAEIAETAEVSILIFYFANSASSAMKLNQTLKPRFV